MNKWLVLEPPEQLPTVPESPQGVNVNVFVSPYDAPEAVRGRRDPELDRFVIEFRYLTDEPVRKESHGPAITLRVGRRSGRLYGIELDTDALRAESVELRVDVKRLATTLVNTVNSPDVITRPDNASLASAAIRDHADELLAGIATQR